MDPSGGGQARIHARSIADLIPYVKNLPEIRDDTSIRVYYRSSDTLLKQAEGYAAANDPEREYIQLMKFATFLVEKLPKHKQYGQAEGKQLKHEYSFKLKDALSRLDTLKQLLKHAYELRAQEEAEAEAARRRAAEEAEKAKIQRELEKQKERDRIAAEAAAEAEALRQQKEAAERHQKSTVTTNDKDDDEEEDDLLARARRLRLAHSASKPSETIDAISDEEIESGDHQELSPQELADFERQLEHDQSKASAEIKETIPNPVLDEIFAPGKVVGGVDAIGNSSVAKPHREKVIEPGYAITVTPFTSGVLQPDVVENNPPLIDLNAATLRQQPSLMFGIGIPTVSPVVSQPHLMDLTTIPNPQPQPSPVASGASSPLLSFAPPPIEVPKLNSSEPVKVSSAVVHQSPLPTVAAVVPSAPPLEEVETPSCVTSPPTVRAAAITVVEPVAVEPVSSKPKAVSFGDAAVMERPRKKKSKESILEESAEALVSPKPAATTSSGSSTPPTSVKRVSFQEPSAPPLEAPHPSDAAPTKQRKAKSKSRSQPNSNASSGSQRYNVLKGTEERVDPAIEQDPLMSITQTIRNKQYSPPSEIRGPIAVPVGPTCTNDRAASSPSPSPSPSPPPSTMVPIQMVQSPTQMHMHGGHLHHHHHNHAAMAQQYARPAPGQAYYTPPSTQPQFVQMHNQQVPIVYSPFQNPQMFQNAQQILYQPQGPTGASTANNSAMLPMMYGVPVSFRPQMLNIYGQQTNRPQMTAPTIAPTKLSAATAAEASAPPLLRSRELEDSSESSDEEAVTASPKQTKQSRSKSKPKPKPALRKKEPPLINGLRQIDIDGEIFDSFMRAAHGNTSREIETCGIICGRLNDDETGFSVTHLIIPKQTGTTDTCATTDEEEIFTYQMKKDLLTLGWIHTHPTQACFLSSVDLHTQASYQGLFPEAMAIVIAPKDRTNFSIFHLTNHGLMNVQACPLKGFHLHDEVRLYEPTTHVKLRWGQKKYKLVDMR